jgi:hypothetical protein
VCTVKTIRCDLSYDVTVAVSYPGIWHRVHC